MRRTRIVVVRLGGVLHGLITRVIEQEPDMELLAELPTLDSLASFVRETRPDCVIARLERRRLPVECVDALEAHPNLLILGVVGDAADLGLYEIRQQTHEVGEFGTDLLLNLIRRTTAERSAGADRADTNGTRQL